MTNRELVDRAFAMQPRAYVPYSKFRVGAALLTEDGSVFTGCNVENAAYGCCICGEQTAIVKAVSEGHRNFKALAVVGDSADYCLPCGICRQILSEFVPDAFPVICANAAGEFKEFKLGEILAHAFRLEK